MRRLAVAVETSTLHSSRPVGASTIIATCLPSGDQRGLAKRKPFGSLTLRSGPPLTGLKLSVRSQGVRALAGPLLRGFMRMPARRNSGSASSVMDGKLERPRIASMSPLGLMLTAGVGLASMMSPMGAGGVM